MARFATNVAPPVENKRALKSAGRLAGVDIKDAKTQLFTLAVTTLLKDKYYESAGSQYRRIVELVHHVTKVDPEWVANLARWVRNEANMRTVSIVIAAEYVKAGGRNGRAVVDSVIQRADEPAEMIGYWHNVYGRRIPAAVKRGVADATVRVLNEYTVQKYDGGARDYRLGDVVQLVHPKPKAEWQDELFKYTLDRRYQGADAVPGESLTRIRMSQELDTLIRRDGVQAFVNRPEAAELLNEAGWTWERLSGYGKFTAATWESIIPTMGYMALLRNLRNFDEAGIGREARDYVKSILSDAEQVRRSRQFPFRFYVAFKQLDSVTWGETLETALDISVENMPEFNGQTLTAVDTSGSMSQAVTPSLSAAEIGALFGVALAKRNDGEVVAWASRAQHVDINSGTSVLKGISKVLRTSVGFSTNLDSVTPWTKGKQRTVVFTDLQVQQRLGQFKGWVHYFDLAGYGRSPATSDNHKWFMYSGWNDSMVKNAPYLEMGRAQTWPWDD